MTAAIDRAALDEMVEMMGGMTEIVDDIVETYLHETPTLVATIAAANSVEDVRMAAHTLKSSSRSVGAVVLGDLAEEIETASRSGSLDDVTDAMAAVSPSYDDAAALLADWQSIPTGLSRTTGR
jgi:HPt (histidine-containing phosphotransfer) domain-containing protein